MTEINLPPLPEGWETELLDWVSACQSAYHIDNTPGHRFGGLGSNLEENRSEIVCFVRGLIESHATALQLQDREDTDRLDWLDKVAHCADWVEGEPTKRVIRADDGAEFMGDTWREAIDHARRIEGKLE